jgi:hypothetical protein
MEPLSLGMGSFIGGLGLSLGICPASNFIVNRFHGSALRISLIPSSPHSWRGRGLF